ncbi:TPA: GIY-YIG nuclease family protein [Enterobacter hormaechei subsp. steigerwaltii]|nr:GIY-YIG nuclease family protein [Enterobacter hormaechei subsp. steigerwaltii]
MSRKLTKEEINGALNARGIQLIGEYKDTRTKTRFRGCCGHEWEAKPNSIRSGKGCPFCAGMRLTKQDINERLKGRGITLLEEYTNNRAPLLFKGECGHEWRARYDGIQQGTGCPTCAGQGQTRESINERLKSRGIEMVGEFNGLGTTANTKTTFKGACGHTWISRTPTMLRGSGCPVCGGRMRKTHEQVKEELAALGITLLSAFSRVRDQVAVRGECGHEWRAVPYSMLNSGTGCPRCAGNTIRNKESVNAELAARGISMTGDYLGNKSHTAFTAKCGHQWEATPNAVLRGTGCPKCAQSGHWTSPISFTYVMAYSNGTTKIGIANDVSRRLRELRSRNAGEYVQLVAVYQFGDGTGRAQWEAEQAAHKHFAERHAGLTGFDGATELFKITPAEACEYLRGAGGKLQELEQ